jgi:hypothetical protein
VEIGVVPLAPGGRLAPDPAPVQLDRLCSAIPFERERFAPGGR